MLKEVLLSSFILSLTVVLLDQFSRGFHLSPDILDVLIESHILTKLEFHNTRIPQKPGNANFSEEATKKAFSFAISLFFISH